METDLTHTKTAHNQKFLGSNPIAGVLDGNGVKAAQVWLTQLAWFFIDASNDC
jgi:hypothetical protein